MSGLLERIAGRRVAVAAPEAKPAEPAAPASIVTAPPRRGVRRRARYLRQLREVQLRDLGGFILELYRFGHQRPDLVRLKVELAARTDAELRALEAMLDRREPRRELREAGIGGACDHCGAVHGSLDNFCAACGQALRSR